MKTLRSGLRRLRSSPQKLDHKPVEAAPDTKQLEVSRRNGAEYSPVSVSQQASDDWQPLKLTVNEAFDQARSAMPCMSAVTLGTQTHEACLAHHPVLAHR